MTVSEHITTYNLPTELGTIFPRSHAPRGNAYN
jgi:hypothetical protein